MEVSVESIPELLRATGRFSLVEPAALAPLLAEGGDTACLRALAPGEIFLQEGDLGDALYVVLEGSAQVFRAHLSGEVVLARLFAGEHLGEQALLPGGSGRRSASARAAEPTVVLRLSRSAFDRLVQHSDGLVARLSSAGRDQLLAGLAAHGELFQTLVAEEDFSQALQEVVLPPGSILMRQGKPADALFLITHGVVGISRREVGQTVQLGQAGVGECVGELGLLQRQPRAATVTALTPVRAVRVDGDWFARRYAASDRLQAWMGTLEGACRLPARGLVTRHGATLDGRPALTNLYHFDHRPPVAVTLAVGEPVINAQEVGGVPTLEVVYEAPGVRHVLRLRGDRLVGVSGVGEWPDLPAVMERLLDGKPLQISEIQGFEYGGRLSDTAPTYTDEILCICLQLPRTAVRRAIRTGCRDLASVQARTGCATVCGGCAGRVQDLLGGQGFAPATVEVIQEHLPDVQSFFIRPVEGPVAPASPGQHLVVRARIGSDTVERAYTISGVDPEGYEITVKREPQGVFSGWLFERGGHGETITLLPPAGHVVWTPAEAPTLVFVAGIGATLAMAIARRACAGDLETGPVVVHQSARGGFVFDQELADLAGAGQLELIRRRTDQVGRLPAAEVAELAARWPGARCFLCGPPGYVAQVQGALEQAGVAPERIHVEVFEHAGGPAAEPVVEAGSFFLVPPPPPRPWHAALARVARGAWVSLGRLVPTRRATLPGLDPRVPLAPAPGTRAEGVAQLARHGATVAVVGEAAPVAVHRVGEAAAIHKILSDSEHFDRGERTFGAARTVLGPGLLVGPTAEVRHAADRAVAETAFGPPALEGQIAALLRTVQAARAEIIARADQRPVVDLGAFGARLAFSFFFRSMAADLDDAGLTALADEIFPAVDTVLDLVDGALHGDPAAAPAGLADALASRLGGLGERLRQHPERLTASQRNHAFVQAALAADFDPARFAERLAPFVVAGHETTGAVIGRLWWELARRPEIEAALLKEIEDFQGHAPRAPRPSDYVDRPLTLAVFFETVRLHPPLDRLVRSARTATAVPWADGTFACPAGGVVVGDLSALHRDPARFPEPEEWRPERFLTGVNGRAPRAEQGRRVWEAAQTAQAEGWFLPFGAGPGRCAGRHLALLEVVLALDGLLPVGRFEALGADAEPPASRGFLNRPAPGTLAARLHPRG